MPDPLASWRATPAKSAILEFVAAVSDPGSADFVPEPERVAVFDNDDLERAGQAMLMRE